MKRLAAIVLSVMIAVTGLPLLGLDVMTAYAKDDPIPADQIESISVTPKEPFYLIENVDGYWDDSAKLFVYDGYSFSEGDQCTIHCKDGSDVVFTCDSSTSDWWNGDDRITIWRYNLFVGDDPLPWEPGLHYCEVYYAIGDDKWTTNVPVTLLPEEEGKLRKAREDAKRDLDFYYIEYLDPDEYRSAQYQEILHRVDEAKTAIDKAESADEVDSIYSDTESTLNKVINAAGLGYIEHDVEMYIEDIKDYYAKPADPGEDYFTPENRQKLIECANDCIAKLNALVAEANGPADTHQYEDWNGYCEAADQIRSEVTEFYQSLPVREDKNIELVLSQERFIYNGNQQKPDVKVVSDGEVLPESAYVLTWPAGMVNAGIYTIDCYLTGEYRGTNANVFYIDTAPNPLIVQGKSVKLKYKKLRKKAQTIANYKAYTISGAQGQVMYTLAGIDKTKYKKYFKVNAVTGAIKVKKKLKKGEYELLIKVTSDGGVNYDPAEEYVSIFVKVK